MKHVLLLHIFTTFFMTGLCWFVQIVHYPLFRMIPEKVFPSYEKKNIKTGFITIPIMVTELLTGLYLLYNNQNLFFFLNIVFLGIIGLSTVIFQGPIHLKLRQNVSPELISRLIQTNWIRTISWTVRTCLLMYLMGI